MTVWSCISRMVLSKDKENTKTRCTYCHKTIELSSSGRSLFNDHAKGKKHIAIVDKRKPNQNRNPQQKNPLDLVDKHCLKWANIKNIGNAFSCSSLLLDVSHTLCIQVFMLKVWDTSRRREEASDRSWEKGYTYCGRYWQLKVKQGQLERVVEMMNSEFIECIRLAEDK